MLLNTRATFTTRLARTLAWNMPQHAEPFLMPNRPDHPVPQVHARLAKTASGYVAIPHAGRGA